MPTSASENRQKEASRRRKPAGLLHPARRDPSDRKASQEGQGKEAVGRRLVFQDSARIKLLAEKTDSFLEQRGWTSLNAESRRFLGCMMMLGDSESVLGEWEKKFPQVPLRAAICLWQETGHQNLSEFLVALGGHPKADLIRSIRWVDLCEAFDKNAAECLKSATREADEAIDCCAARSLSDEITRLGFRVVETNWRVLPDGSAICLSTGQTMNRNQADEMRLEAEKQKAMGCGIRLIAAAVS